MRVLINVTDPDCAENECYAHTIDVPTLTEVETIVDALYPEWTELTIFKEEE